MIKIDVESYCENCDELSPVCLCETVSILNRTTSVTNTIVCKHRDRCKAIYRKAKEELENAV